MYKIFLCSPLTIYTHHLIHFRRLNCDTFCATLWETFLPRILSILLIFLGKNVKVIFWETFLPHIMPLLWTFLGKNVQIKVAQKATQFRRLKWSETATPLKKNVCCIIKEKITMAAQPKKVFECQRREIENSSGVYITYVYT